MELEKCLDHYFVVGVIKAVVGDAEAEISPALDLPVIVYAQNAVIKQHIRLRSAASTSRVQNVEQKWFVNKKEKEKKYETYYHCYFPIYRR